MSEDLANTDENISKNTLRIMHNSSINLTYSPRYQIIVSAIAAAASKDDRCLYQLTELLGDPDEHVTLRELLDRICVDYGLPFKNDFLDDFIEEISNFEGVVSSRCLPVEMV